MMGSVHPGRGRENTPSERNEQRTSKRSMVKDSKRVIEPSGVSKKEMTRTGPYKDQPWGEGSVQGVDISKDSEENQGVFERRSRLPGKPRGEPPQTRQDVKREPSGQ